MRWFLTGNPCSLHLTKFSSAFQDSHSYIFLVEGGPIQNCSFKGMEEMQTLAFQLLSVRENATNELESRWLSQFAVSATEVIQMVSQSLKYLQFVYPWINCLVILITSSISYFIIIILINSTSQILYVTFLSNLFNLSRTEKHIESADTSLLIYEVFVLHTLMLCFCHINIYDSYVSSL